MELLWLLLGINITTTRIISEEIAFKNDVGIKKAVFKCILISLGFGIMSSVIFVCNRYFIVYKCLHNKVSNSIVYLIAAALPMISVSACISGYFTAVRRVYKYIIANFLEYMAKIIVTIILLKKYIQPGGVENICFALILGDVVSELCSFTFNIFVFTHDINKHVFNIFKSNDFYLHRILRILVPICFTSYIRSGLSTFKQLLIPNSLEKNGINCTKALAEYGTITSMAMPIITFPATFLYAVTSLLIPEFSSFFAKKDYSKINHYSKKLLSITFIFSIILCIIFFVFGNKLGKIIYHDESVRILYYNFCTNSTIYVFRYYS